MACYSDDEKDTLFSDTVVSRITDSTTSSEANMEHGFVRTVFANGDDDDIQDPEEEYVEPRPSLTTKSM